MPLPVAELSGSSVKEDRRDIPAMRSKASCGMTERSSRVRQHWLNVVTLCCRAVPVMWFNRGAVRTTAVPRDDASRHVAVAGRPLQRSVGGGQLRLGPEPQIFRYTHRHDRLRGLPEKRPGGVSPDPPSWQPHPSGLRSLACPTGAASNRLAAKSKGIRTQPCDTEYPGRGAAVERDA